ncbi:hypothetical protein [Pseudomonas extremaustralis]
MKYKIINQKASLPVSECQLYDDFLNDLFSSFLTIYFTEIRKIIIKSKLDLKEQSKLLRRLEVAVNKYKATTDSLTIQEKDKLAVKTSIYLLNREILGQVRRYLSSYKPVISISKELKITPITSSTDDEAALNAAYFFETISKYKSKFDTINKNLITSIKQII